MQESTKEFLGIKPASLFASLGFIIVFVPIYFKLQIALSSILFLLGMVSTSYALYINFNKKEKVKWTKTNQVMHIIMLILMILGIIFYYIFM
jgi:hypothetical protein